MPSSTVIVVAYQSGEALTRCLDSLDGADAIVVNNGDRGPEIDACGSIDVIRENWEQNLRQSARFVGSTITGEDLAEIRQWVASFLAEHEALLLGRVAGGFIRDCDGDLHAGGRGRQGGWRLRGLAEHAHARDQRE